MISVKYKWVKRVRHLTILNKSAAFGCSVVTSTSPRCSERRDAHEYDVNCNVFGSFFGRESRKKGRRTKSMCFTVPDAKVSILAESVDTK